MFITGAASPSRSTPFPPPISSSSSSNLSKQPQIPVEGNLSRRSPNRSYSLSAQSRLKPPSLTGYPSTFGTDEAAANQRTQPLDRLPPGRPYLTSASSHTRQTSRSRISRSASDQGRTRPQPLPKPPPPPLDPAQAALLHAARDKLASQDQEAMRRLRSTLLGMSGPSVPTSLPPQTSNTAIQPSYENLSRASSVSRHPLSSSTCETPAEDLVEEAGSNKHVAAKPTLAEWEVDHVIAVVGHSQVGKSTAIRRAAKAWGVSSPVTSHTARGYTVSSYFSHIEAGGKLKYPLKVRFAEMDLGAFDFESDTGKFWPDDFPLPSGAILCYDATSKDSLKGIPEALQRFTVDDVPLIVFACKSDPDASLEVDAAYGNSLGEPYNVGLIEVTVTTPDGKHKMRNGLRWLMYKLEQKQRRQQKKSSPKTVSPAKPKDSRSGPLTSPESDVSSGVEHGMLQHRLKFASTEGLGRANSDASICSSLRGTQKVPESRSGERREPEQRTPEANGDLPVILGQTAALLTNGLGQQPADAPLYLCLDDLFNQLFSAIVTAENHSFVQAFLMTYRRFCHPATLMHEFLDRIRAIEVGSISKNAQMWAVLRLVGALIDWTSRYPGDLADQQTKAVFSATLAHILEHTFIAHLTVELLHIEESSSSTKDIDQSWARQLEADLEVPAAVQLSTCMAALGLDGDLPQDYESSIGKSDRESTTIDITPSTHSPSASSLEADHSPSKSKFGSGPHLLDRSSSALLHQPESVHWQQGYAAVMRYDPQRFAIELTKLQWGLFSTIRPRDVFRHDFGKERNDAVGKSIQFFNYLSRWVATLLLSSAKAKYRAQLYEHFMAIAHQLRLLNNYDSLYSVISGMRETSIHRLAQTHALVRPAVHIDKDFQSHLELMDPRGNYVHYRRALQADISNGKAAIPLLTTILGLVNRLQSVRPQDVREDGQVQWDKFARFAEILAIIPECQAKGSMVSGPPTAGFRALIEDMPVTTSEDELFERSLSLESSGVSGGGTIMRRFGNLMTAQGLSRFGP